MLYQVESTDTQAAFNLNPETTQQAAQVINSLADALFKEMPKKIKKLELALDSIREIIRKEKISGDFADKIVSICNNSIETPGSIIPYRSR